MSSPYEDDTFTEASDSQTEASVGEGRRKEADLDHDDDSLSRTHTSVSQDHWSEDVSQSPDRTSLTSENSGHLQVYSVSSIGESASRSSLSSSGRIVERWSHSSTTAEASLSQDISTELTEDSAADRDASYSEDFITTSATSVTEEDVRSDRSSESGSVKEELEDETSDHHGDGYHGYSSDDFESSGGQSSATESVSAEKESEARSNFLHRACQVVKQNSSALLDTELMVSSSTLHKAVKPGEEDIEVTPELLEFCSRKLQLLKERAVSDAEGSERSPGRKQDTGKPTTEKTHRSQKPSSSSASKEKRCTWKEKDAVDRTKTSRRHKKKLKLPEERGSSTSSVRKAVEIVPSQTDLNSSVDLVGETGKTLSIDLSKKNPPSTDAQSTDSSVPRGLVDRIKLDTMMLDMKRGAKAKVHNPRTCRSCVKRQGALRQEEFVKKSRANVERKLIDAKVEQHLITHDSLTLIGEIARTLPRPTDDPNDVWARLMKGNTMIQKDGENNRDVS